MLRLPGVSQDDNKGIWSLPFTWQCVVPRARAAHSHQISDTAAGSLIPPLHCWLFSPGDAGQGGSDNTAAFRKQLPGEAFGLCVWKESK